MIAALFPQPSLAAIYGLLLVNAIARTFEQPVDAVAGAGDGAARAAQPRRRRAHVSGGRLSNLLGPSLGGIALRPWARMSPTASARC